MDKLEKAIERRNLIAQAIPKVRELAGEFKMTPMQEWSYAANFVDNPKDCEDTLKSLQIEDPMRSKMHESLIQSFIASTENTPKETAN